MRVIDVDAPDHMLECIWLRELERRADADAFLARAIAATPKTNVAANAEGVADNGK